MRTPFRLAVALAVVLLATSACAFAGDDRRPSTTPGSPSPTGVGASSAGSGARHPPRPRVAAPPCPPTCAPGRPWPRRSPTPPSGRRSAPTQVVVAAWSPVTWNDGSLGCPQKGMGYTQALVEGELLLLQTDTGLFQYHARERRPVRLLRDPVADYTVGG